MSRHKPVPPPPFQIEADVILNKVLCLYLDGANRTRMVRCIQENLKAIIDKDRIEQRKETSNDHARDT